MKPYLTPILAALLLSGCVSLGEKPPATLLRLSAQDHPPADAAWSAGDGKAIAVLAPTTPAMLSTDGVAVLTSDTAVAYLAKARWADQPARLFADLLGETIAARTGRMVIDRRQNALTPAQRLAGRLNSFVLDARHAEVVVSYDAALTPGDGKPALTRRFEARVPAPSEQPAAVARALNEAANKVAADVADWIGK